jgi:WD40 repeat protein
MSATRWALWGQFALLAGALVGCGGSGGHGHGEAGKGGGLGGGAGRGVGGGGPGGAAGTMASGCGGLAGGGGQAAAGAGGGPAPSAVDVCGDTLALSSAMRLAPAAAGQRYLRCGTIGPERDWMLALSGDGRRLAAVTAAGTVRLFATDEEWREIAQLAAPLGRWDAAAFSPDGTRLATLSAETGEVTLWNAADGTLARSFAGPPGSTIDSIVSSLTFSADATRIATSLGTVIDVASGAERSWYTGMPVTAARVVNPQNLGTGEAVASLRFVAGETRLFADVRFQVGNSPTSQRLEVRNPVTGQATVLFQMFDRALTGFAVSPDGNLVAISTTEEAQVSGLTTGLFVARADTGAVVISMLTAFADAVLGFSPDSALLYTRNGDTIAARDPADLHVVRTIALPAGAVFRGVAPNGRIVTAEAAGGTTSWRDPVTGVVAETLPVALASAIWAAGGAFGAGTSASSGRLFHMWSEPEVKPICAPRAPGNPAAVVTTGASPDGQWLALGRDDGAVDIATAGTSNAAVTGSVQTGLGPLSVVRLSDGAVRLATLATMTQPDTLLRVFDVATTRPLRTTSAGLGSRLALSPDGNSVSFVAPGPVVASTLLAIDVDSGTTRLTINGPFGIQPDRFSPDSARLAVRTDTGIDAWRLADQMIDATYPPGGAIVLNAALSPDWSVVGGIRATTQTFGVWRTTDGAQILDLPGGSNSPGVAGFSRDGSLVGAAIFVLHTHAVDFTAIFVVDVATGQTHRLFGASPGRRQLQIGPGGDRLYTLESPVVAVWCR